MPNTEALQVSSECSPTSAIGSTDGWAMWGAWTLAISTRPYYMTSSQREQGQLDDHTSTSRMSARETWSRLASMLAPVRALLMARDTWRLTMQKGAQAAENTWNEELATKRVRQKKRTTSFQAPLSFTCDNCERDSHSRVGLYSHSRRCSTWNTMS